MYTLFHGSRWAIHWGSWGVFAFLRSTVNPGCRWRASTVMTWVLKGGMDSRRKLVPVGLCGISAAAPRVAVLRLGSRAGSLAGSQWGEEDSGWPEVEEGVWLAPLSWVSLHLSVFLHCVFTCTNYTLWCDPTCPFWWLQCTFSPPGAVELSFGCCYQIPW